jgi:endoglucanase
MRKYIWLACFAIISGLFQRIDAQAPFSRGVNVTSWFQTSGPRQIQFSKYSKKDFENIRSLGCDVIRLPINLFSMTEGKPDYKIDTLFFYFLDQAVTWAEELSIYLILDNHTTDDLASKNPDLETILSVVWKQMAEHYKGRSSYIVYEIMNEPNGITTAAWGKIQQTAMDAIREVDTTHTLIVGPSSWNTYNELNSLPVYTDKKLIYTFHFYDPFIFTHQGASWPVPSLSPLTAVPFPYNADSMPSLPDALKGTWIQSAYNNYDADGTVAHVKELIDIAVAFMNSRNADMYCGEFGVYISYCNDTDRIYWYSETRKYLEEKKIAWTVWDYKGGFGLFKKGSNEMFDYDLNIPLVNTLGLIEPAQFEYEIKPDTAGFSVYTDFIGENTVEASYANGGTIDFYSYDNPNNGNFCLSRTGSGQYGSIGFNFIPDKDLSLLVADNYALSLLVRGNTPGTYIELRFIDTKTSDPGDHPWRMNYTLRENDAAWDGKCHPVYIPLSDFMDQGSWDNAWYNPIGAFNWKAVDRFEIVTDLGSLKNKAFWFDNIFVANLDTAQIFDTSAFILPTNLTPAGILALTGFIIYPNPIKERATIFYSLKNHENVDICIYNLSGQRIKSLLISHQPAGDYSIAWNTDNENGSKVSEGVYICRILIATKVITLKISVVRD